MSCPYTARVTEAYSTLTPTLSQSWERGDAGRKEEVDGTALAIRHTDGAEANWKRH